MARNVRGYLYGAGGYMFEFSVLDMLCRADPNTVRGTESARCDGGVYNGPLALGADPLQMLVDAHEKSKEKVIYAFDVKKSIPSSTTRLGRTWQIKFSERQIEHASAIVFGGTMSSKVVAFIPMAWLRPDISTSPGRPLWKSRQVPAAFPYGPLPEEFLPFALPLELLPEAVKNMMEYARNPDTVAWINPWAGTDITPPSPLTPTTIQALLPANPLMRSANFDLLEKIKDAFKSHGQTFSAHDCDIRPITGDLKFRHKPTGIYSFVEMKVSLCSYDEDTNTINHRRHRMFGGVDKPRPIFHGWNDWDYILTALSGVDHAFLLPRDALPLHWFEAVSDWSESSNNLELKFPNRKAMEYYKVSLADPKQLAETVEKILLTPHYPDPTKFTFKAHGVLPPRFRQGDVIIDAEEDINEDLDELDLNEFDESNVGMEEESATEEESNGKQEGAPTKYRRLQRI